MGWRRNLERLLKEKLHIQRWHIIALFLLVYDLLAVNFAYFFTPWVRFDCRYRIRCQDAATCCRQKLGWKIVECADTGGMRSIEDIHAEIMTLVNGSLMQAAADK